MMHELTTWATRHHVSHEALRELFGLFAPETPDPGGAGSESRAQSEIRLSTPGLKTALWRNNKGACKDETGRLIRYGLGHESPKLEKIWKSADLIGITPIQITPRHVGYTLGVFTAVEVKKPGWSAPKNDHERAQATFLADVARYGGLAMFATSAAHYQEWVTKWRNV